MNYLQLIVYLLFFDSHLTIHQVAGSFFSSKTQPISSLKVFHERFYLIFLKKIVIQIVLERTKNTEITWKNSSYYD